MNLLFIEPPIKRGLFKKSAALFSAITFFISSLVISPHPLLAAPSVGAPETDPDHLLAGGTAEVLVTSRITTQAAEPPVISNGVYLNQIDAANRVIKKLGTMLDNGAGGDRAAGDGIFTLKVTITQPPQGNLYLQVSAAFTGVVRRTTSTVKTLPVTANNLPPQFTSAPLGVGVNSLDYKYVPTAKDPEGGLVTLSLVSGPSGMKFENGALLWVPGKDQIGNHPVEVKAADPQNLSSTQKFTVNVIEFNLSPTITSVPAFFAKTGTKYLYDTEAYDPEGKPLTFKFMFAAPSGMIINAQSGLVEWTPAAGNVGSHQVVIRATDPLGSTGDQVFDLEVFNNTPLQLLSPAGEYTVLAGQSLDLPFQANLASAIFSADPLPGNASLNQTSFIFKPTLEQAGIHVVNFQASAGDQRVSNPVTIRVTKPNTAPVILPFPQQTLKEGEDLSLIVSASDAEGDPLFFSAPGLNLPNALFNQVTQQFTFTPSFDQAGSYDVIFQVSDGTAFSQTTVSIKVEEAAPPVQALDLVVDKTPNPTFRSGLSITGSVIGQTGGAPQAEKPVFISALVPASAKQNEALTVEITGTNTNFDPAVSTVDFGDGITAKKFEVLTPVSAKAEISVDTLAALGARQVRIITGEEEAPAVVAFFIEKGSAKISGRVIDGFTNQPLAGARIGVNGTAIFVLSGADGKFTLTDVPVGEQTLLVTRANYSVERISVILNANENLELGSEIKMNALARPPNFGGNLPAAKTVASVLDRGVTLKGGGLTLEQAKAVVSDTMIAVGGIEAGVLDAAGNQLNPKITGAGDLSLTQEGVEQQALALMQGDVFTLKEFIDLLKGVFVFPTGLTEGDVVAGFQKAVNEAWANPSDPGSAMAIVLFNEGRNLLPQPPVLTPDTRLNQFQIFLLLSSFMTFNFASLTSSIEGILKANNINFPSLLPPEKFPQPEGSKNGDSSTLFLTLTAFIAKLNLLRLPLAEAAGPAPGPNPCADQYTACHLQDLMQKKTFSKVWRAIGANIIAESASAALSSAKFAFMQQAAMSLMIGTSGGRLGATVAVLNLAAAAVQGAVSVLFFKLVMGWFIALTAASFEPPPPQGRGSFFDPAGNFVIRFDLVPEHIRAETATGQVKRDHAYHLYRVPNCQEPVDAAKAVYIPLKAEPDFSDATNKKKPYLGIHRFVVPASMLEPETNCFRIRAFQYLHNREVPLVEDMTPIDTSGDGQLVFAEFEKAGLGGESAFFSADANFDSIIDAAEFGKFSTGKIPQEFDIGASTPNTPELRGLMGRVEFKPGSEPGSYKSELAAREQELQSRAANRIDPNSKGFKTRTNIVDFHADSPFSRGNAEFLPEIEDFVNNRKAFTLTDDAILKSNISGQQAIFDGDAAVAEKIANEVYQKNLNTNATAEQKAAIQKLVRAQRLKTVANTQIQFAGIASENVEKTIADIETGRLTKGRIILNVPTFPNPETTQAASLTYNLELTPETKASVLYELGGGDFNPDSAKSKAFVTSIQSNINARNANNESFDAQEPVLKQALKVSSGLSDEQINQKFAKYFPKQSATGIKGQAIARMTDANEKELRGLIADMKKRRVGPLTIQEPSIDPRVIGFQKGVGAFTNFAGQVVGGSSALLTFLQSVQVLSSDFSHSCFTTKRPAVTPPTEQFPPGFEPYPGPDEPSAIVRELKTGPRQGFLQREYPGDDEHVSAADAGFPPGFLSSDKRGYLYAVNMGSTERFGGRIFRFKVSQAEGETGVPKPLGAERELAAAINYFSLSLQVARPAFPIAMTTGPAFKVTNDVTQEEVEVQDLYVADIDIVDGHKRILEVAVSQIESLASFYGEIADRPGSKNHRHRIVGQNYFESADFKFTGPSDMETGPDPSSPVPVQNKNSVLMISDEENIFAIYKNPGSSTLFMRKVITLQGRRWSGMAFDRLGRFYFADYLRGDIFVMTWETLRAIIRGDQPHIIGEVGLKNDAYKIASGFDRPGDLELEGLSTHPGGVLHISTFRGIVPLTLPIVGKLGNAQDVRVSLLGIEQTAQVDAERGVFIVTPSRENLEAMSAKIRAKKLDVNGREVWREYTVFIAEHGVTILTEPLA